MTQTRHAARDFLSSIQVAHGLPVSDRAMGVVQLVVGELVTNAHKYAPGPRLVNLEHNDGAVEISVWDIDPTLPVVQAADPRRVGQHGMEVVTGVCHSFEMRREPVKNASRPPSCWPTVPAGTPAGSRRCDRTHNEVPAVRAGQGLDPAALEQHREES